MRTLLTVLIALVLSAEAIAHSKLRQSLPEKGSVLTQLPETLVLEYGNEIRLTKVDLENWKGEIVKVVKSPTELKKSFEFPIKLEAKGIYKVTWRGLGIDGHAMKGHYSFEIR